VQLQCISTNLATDKHSFSDVIFFINNGSLTKAVKHVASLLGNHKLLRYSVTDFNDIHGYAATPSIDHCEHYSAIDVRGSLHKLSVRPEPKTVCLPGQCLPQQ